MSVPDFYAALGVTLPATGINASVSCFADPEAHRSGDRSPSCSVHVVTGAWHCFTCGAAGGPFDAALALGLRPREAADLCKAHDLWKGPTEPGARRPPTRQQRPAHPAPVAVDAARLPTSQEVAKWAERALSDPRARELASAKGWTRGALVATETGWDGSRFTFPIRDERGDLVNLVRYLPGGDPKSMALKGRPRDLFPAPEALRSSARELMDAESWVPEVYIVEGEPDVLSALSVSHGNFTFAVPGAQGWRRAYADRFRGMAPIVLTDHDEPGRKLAARVSADLSAAGIEHTVVDWPAVMCTEDLPAGWDFGDYALALGRRPFA